MTSIVSKWGFISGALALTVIAGTCLAESQAKAPADSGIAEPTKTQYEQGAKHPYSVVPTLIAEDWWISSHDKMVHQALTTHPDTVFLGDSITAFMNPEIIHKVIGPNAVNFGIPGD